MLQIGYIVFLMVMTYVVLIKIPYIPSWQEIFCMAYVFTLGCEKFREVSVCVCVCVRVCVER